MKRLLVGSAALLVALSTSAFSTSTLAADMTPVFKTVPTAAPFDWSGVYGGVNAGYSWGRVPYDATSAGAPISSGTLTPGSFVGGGQFGYNYQMGSVVLGLEADIAWRQGRDTSIWFLPNGLDTMSFRSEQSWVGTLRPRAGIAIDNWLVYATGGLAYGSFKHDFTESRPTVAGASRTAADSDVRAGWTVGAGVEYAPSKRWSLGLEYLYADYGKANLNQPPQALGGVAFSSSTSAFHDQSHLLRGKLNYHFDWGNPGR
jgi:outer membrane immunogenic protein